MLSKKPKLQKSPRPPSPHMYKKTSTTLTFFNIIKAYLGSGLLVIPYGARCGGMWLSLIGILLLALGSTQTLKMLVRTKRHLLKQRPHVASERITFDALGHYAFGAPGRRVAVFAQVVTNLGIIVGYAIFVGQTLLSAAVICGATRKHLDPVVWGVHISLFLVVSFPLLAALAMLRSMRKLGPVSLVGTLAIALAICAVFYSSALVISERGAADVPWARWETFPTFFGLLVFGFAIHGVVLPIEEGMANPEDVERVLNGANVIVVLIYSTFSVLCYYAYGDAVDPSILNNLPEKTQFEQVIKIATSVLLSVSMLLTVPLFFFSVFRTMETRSGSGESTSAMAANDGDDYDEEIENNNNNNNNNMNLEESLLPHRGELFHGSGLLSPPGRYVASPAHALGGVVVQQHRPTTEHSEHSNGYTDGKNWWRTSMIRVLCVLATIIVAILLGPLFSEVISLVGAFSMSMVCFILPAAFYLKILGTNLSTTEKGIGWLLLIFGVVALFVATWQSMQSMVYYFSNGGKEQLCGTTGGGGNWSTL